MEPRTLEGRGAADDRGGALPPPAGPHGPRPCFWKELYAFALIGLGTWILGVVLIAPRLARSRQTVEMELELESTVLGLAEKERQYEAAIAAMENDPFYREAVYRAVLGVRRTDEIYIREPRTDAIPVTTAGAAGAETSGAETAGAEIR